MEDVRAIAAEIQNIITNAPNQTILGVRLANAVKRSRPDFPFAYQCRNVRQFLRMHVPEVVEKGRSGADLVYGLGETLPPLVFAKNEHLSSVSSEQPPSAETFIPLPISPSHWKAYSNPSYPFLIAMNRESGETTVVPEGKVVEIPWLIIAKPSALFHKEIAQKFVEELDEPLQGQLLRRLADAKWFVTFSAVANRLGVGARWIAFRRQKLIDQFHATLNELDLSTKPRVSRLHTRSQDKEANFHHAVSRDNLKSPLNYVSEDQFRLLIQRVISRMSISDIRELRLPAGLMFDLMNR